MDTSIYSSDLGLSSLQFTATGDPNRFINCFSYFILEEMENYLQQTLRLLSQFTSLARTKDLDVEYELSEVFRMSLIRRHIQI